MRTLTLFAISLVAAGALSAACSSAPPDVIVSGWAQPPSGSGTGPGSSTDAGITGGRDSGHPTGGDSGGVVPGQDGGSPPPPAGDGGAGAAMGVPCDVATMLANNCTGCHSDPPINGSLAGLVTYADLMATAHEDATKNEAQLSLSRMQNAAMPMPPGSLPPAADVTTLQNWINAGYPMGSCGGGGDGGAGEGGGPPPTGGVFANAPPYVAQTGSQTHNAGQDCLQCHNGGGDADRFSIGGTVYDGSGNPVVGAEVRLVDANGTAFSVYTGPTGTFHSGMQWTGPAHIGVRNANNTQNMFTALQSGSQPPAITGGGCSGCHCSGGSCTVPAIHLP